MYLILALMGHKAPSTSIYSTVSCIKEFHPPIKGHEDPSTSIYSTVSCIKVFNPPI